MTGDAARRHAATALPLFAQPAVAVLDRSTMHRRTVVEPGMCGHNALFVGRIGDWTWETVGALCDTDVFGAENEHGAPTYLAFYYLHVRSSAAFHSGLLTFGDRIDVVSRLFGFGSESILTLHKIAPAANGDVASFEPEEAYDEPCDRAVYVESFNRWVARGPTARNDDLVRSSPPGFAHEHLPLLPERYSPRRVYDFARVHHRFERGRTTQPRAPRTCRTEYRVDVTRDVNGVGLIYFAAYFSIVDGAVLALWRRIGRTDAAFMRRIVLDQKMCYLGNAEVGSVLEIQTTLWEALEGGTRDVFDVVVRERDTGRAVAVCALELRAEPGCEARP